MCNYMIRIETQNYYDMKIYQTTTLIAIFAFFFFTASQQVSAQNSDVQLGNEVGNDIGDFEAMGPDGTPMKLSDLRGKVVLVVLWNSKCSHCNLENKKYLAAYEQYHNKDFVNGQGFDIYQIGLDKEEDTWKQAIQDNAFPWDHHVYVPDSWKDRNIRFFGIKNLPGTFLIDQDGIILEKKFTGDELPGLLEKYLKK